MKDRLHLTFPHESIAEPVVCQIAKIFDVVFSIRRASVTHEAGWMDLEIDGSETEIGHVLSYLKDCGVRVDPIEGDIIAG